MPVGFVGWTASASTTSIRGWGAFLVGGVGAWDRLLDLALVFVDDCGDGDAQADGQTEADGGDDRVLDDRRAAFTVVAVLA
jgi:hypothetical protein